MDDTWKSGKYTIYKKKGALQASIIPPTRNDRGWVEKEGAVLLELAPGVGEQQWDWANKINLALGIPDLCKMLETQDSELKLVHQSGETSKTLVVKPGEGQYSGTYMMSLYAKRGPDSHSIVVPLSGGEYQLLLRMAITMAPYLIGWL
jgi:hypothetical protein